MTSASLWARYINVGDKLGSPHSAPSLLQDLPISQADISRSQQHAYLPYDQAFRVLQDEGPAGIKRRQSRCHSFCDQPQWRGHAVRRNPVHAEGPASCCPPSLPVQELHIRTFCIQWGHEALTLHVCDHMTIRGSNGQMESGNRC